MKTTSMLLLALAVQAHAGPSSFADYDLVVNTVDGGNGSSSSTNYTITQSSVGGIFGVSSSVNYSLNSGPAEVTPDTNVDLSSYSSWAAQFFDLSGAETGPGDDYDNDGLTNEEEFLALTDPINPSSRFEFTLSLDEDTQTATLSFSPYLNDSALRVYTLMSQDDSLSATFQSLNQTPNVNAEFTDSRPYIRRRFYRLRISIPE